MPHGNSLEARLGEGVLQDIARRYYKREATSTELATQYGICRQMVPRVAKRGQHLITNEKAPPASTERG